VSLAESSSSSLYSPRATLMSRARNTRAAVHEIELYDLTVFEAVARLSSIGRAARTLGTVQSALTTCIQGLEAELGTQLFDRHSWGVSLTQAGERLLRYARRISDLLDLVRDTVRRDSVENHRPAAPDESPRIPERLAHQARIGGPAPVSPEASAHPTTSALDAPEAWTDPARPQLRAAVFEIRAEAHASCQLTFWCETST
jgi:molybdenum-dependent DNA-binding transcriptional regulator ModE